MIIGFKKEYPGNVLPTQELILSGKKIHTFREDKGNRWKAGMKIHFATGVRTKHYYQFMEGECKSVQKLRIVREEMNRSISFFIDDRQLSSMEIITLIKNDGFNTIADFFRFFLKRFQKAGEDITLRIIHWTDMRY